MEENEKNEHHNQPQKVVPQPQMPNKDPQAMAQSGEQIKYAGFWIRYAAVFIDGLVLIIPNVIIIVVFKMLSISVFSTIFSYLILWLYYILMTKEYQATLGKKAVGIRVVSDKSENLSWGQLILRETIGKWISMVILLIGYIMAGFTKRKQALHDKIASTTVVYNDPNKKTPTWIFIVALIVPIAIVFGVFVSIVLVSLNDARTKARDAGIKATLSSMISDAVDYKDTNSSYKDYKAPANSDVIACSGQPVVNISADEKQMAIFMKSCKEEKKYFCGNPETSLVTETAEVDESYVKSGASVCNSSDIPETSSDNQNTSIKNDSTLLPNNFKDDLLGYEINYPDGWVQQKEEDKEVGVTTITFLPDRANPSMTVYVQSFAGQQVVASEDLSAFLKSVQGDLIKANGKVYDEKDFVYTFADGTKSTGGSFKAEYSDNGIDVKQWLIAIPNGKKLYWFTYVSDINQYDANYNAALAMFDSWKITK